MHHHLSYGVKYGMLMIRYQVYCAMPMDLKKILDRYGCRQQHSGMARVGVFTGVKLIINARDYYLNLL